MDKTEDVSKLIPTFDNIVQARKRIEPYAHKPPVLTSHSVDAVAGGNVFFKCENFQRAGAFKFRGACNAVFSLKEQEAQKGVVTHSSGNHAAALSLAASLRGIPAYVVMPDNSPLIKRRAVEGFGGKITFCPSTMQDREATAQKIIEKTGAILIHSSNNSVVIAGQGTAAIELIEKVPDLDLILTPIGGGGLVSGTAIAAKHISPAIKVMAVEPEMADDAFRSLQSGKLQPSAYPPTVADGLRTSLCELTFAIIQKYLDGIVTVGEKSIIEAMRFVWERMKITIEASSAVCVAALMENKIEAEGKKIGIIISGGNVDLNHLPWQR